MLFNELIKFYEDANKNFNEARGLLKICLEKKTYEKTPQIDERMKNYKDFENKLKFILREYFKADVESEIKKLEKECEKEYDNFDEVKAQKKLELMKGLLK